MTTREMIRAAMGIALIAISAQITVTLGPIPFTLQLFSLSLLGHILNTKELTFMILVYIILGLFGLPIFANLGSGLSMLSKPSFGFLLGFIPFTLLIKKHKITALMCLYSLGATYLVYVMKFIYMTDHGIPFLISQYILMFIPTDLLAIFLSNRIANRIPKAYLSQ